MNHFQISIGMAEPSNDTLIQEIFELVKDLPKKDTKTFLEGFDNAVVDAVMKKYNDTLLKKYESKASMIFSKIFFEGLYNKGENKTDFDYFIIKDRAHYRIGFGYSVGDYDKITKKIINMSPYIFFSVSHEKDTEFQRGKNYKVVRLRFQQHGVVLPYEKIHNIIEEITSAYYRATSEEEKEHILTGMIGDISIEKMVEETLLIKVICEGRLSLALILAEQGAKLDSVTATELLVPAIEQDKLSISLFLVKQGAKLDPEIATKLLASVIKQNRLSFVSILIEQGALKNIG